MLGFLLLVPHEESMRRLNPVQICLSSLFFFGLELLQSCTRAFLLLKCYSSSFARCSSPTVLPFPLRHSLQLPTQVLPRCSVCCR